MDNLEREIQNELAQDNEIGKYMTMMAELGARLRELCITCENYFVNHIGNKFTIEYIALNLRKILELCAMASLACNKPAYETAYKDIENIWNGQDIIKRLEKTYKYIFPFKSYQPTIFNPEDKKAYSNLKTYTGEKLNKANFIQIYKACSEVLHTTNPFRPNKDKYLKFANNVSKWLDIIFQTYFIHQVVPYGLKHKRYLIFFTDYQFSSVKAMGLLVI